MAFNHFLRILYIMPCHKGLTIANSGQNNQILCNNREKIENISSICFSGSNDVKVYTLVLHNSTTHINYNVGLNMSQTRHFWAK